VNIEKRRNLFGVAAGDYHDSRLAGADDPLQQGRNSRIREGLVALNLKGRQRSVVIDEEHCLGRLGYSFQKWREMRSYFWPQQATSFSLILFFLFLNRVHWGLHGWITRPRR
jgi:hypothetical protein